MIKIKFFLFILSLLLISGCISNYKENKMEEFSNISLIPKDLIFGNPDRVSHQISPNGANLSFLAPVNGVLNIWVGPAGNLEKAKPVTNDTFRGIRAYSWTYNNEHIIYIQDRN